MGCRWTGVKKLPAGITEYTQLPWGTDMKLSGDPRVLELSEFVTQEIMLGGEEASDAVAIIMATESITLAEYEGHTYALFISTAEPDGYIGLYEYVCGIRAELPWMIGLGLLGGVGGFVASRKLSDGGLMGSTLGILAGVGLGAGLGFGIRSLAGAKS